MWWATIQLASCSGQIILLIILWDMFALDMGFITHKPQKKRKQPFWLSGALLYIFSLVYWSATTSRFLKGFSPKGTGAMMNGKFR